ncbi:glutathione S-transferase N-terminal domain-containing protein [Natronolimnohabitans sp. A-GB9]|uniref:glutathione S-transferase N-terminal domain-containing protein n=1 Tax=Natronolimnohabitans sp. A-GB9 TaxID=3069757 RepID=UPI0027ADAD31|nr:glutathione S-transferase N-terminal domain-containing protein [Natronolimnohabitans sp. A-GB9]MDQ2049649.1 glutathione S-transferase N-terminal domain-containing protein [Natronolimnohabitans sp. A-GB9]
MTSPDLELYELTGCPYCAKVRWALSDLGLDYESHTVPSSREDRTAVYEASGQYEVPVLVDRTNGVDGLSESDDIIAYLYEEYGDADDSSPSGLLGWLRVRFLGR